MARNDDLRNLRELAASITFGQCDAKRHSGAMRQHRTMVRN